jgi:SpoVK/Ycf46/Vps4 family AAA+-type ATPase
MQWILLGREGKKETSSMPKENHYTYFIGQTENLTHASLSTYLDKSLGQGTSVDLTAVAGVTEGLSGAELACIVNEAAIRAVRRVSEQLKEGVDKTEIDNTVFPEDFEASVQSFFKSRNKKNNSNQLGFAIPQERPMMQRRDPNQIFFTAKADGVENI